MEIRFGAKSIDSSESAYKPGVSCLLNKNLFAPAATPRDPANEEVQLSTCRCRPCLCSGESDALMLPQHSLDLLQVNSHT